jgi:hypothetical protein
MHEFLSKPQLCGWDYVNRIGNPLAKLENHQVIDSKSDRRKDAGIGMAVLFGIDTGRPKTNSSDASGRRK